MYTVRVNGGWNLIDARGCLVRRGTLDEIVEAMKNMW